MLSHADNEVLTRTGAGTPMGETMRRYWIPALLSSEIPEPDCAPVGLRLLGEYLVAFRDTQGRIGLLDEFCPHQGYSMSLGRNEECGLRCGYHAWKFDVSGQCVDMMGGPPNSNFKYPDIRIKAYPTIDQGGVVWAYMGAPEKQPAPPNFEWTQVPQTHRRVSKIRQDCNWLQGLEGGIDTGHAPILHRITTPDTNKADIGINSDFPGGGAPVLEVELTDYGYRYAGIRALGERGNYVRACHYVMPFHQMRPRQAGYKGQETQPLIAGHMWVPMDDKNVMIYNWIYSFGDVRISDEEWGEFERGYDRGPEHPLSDFRSVGNRVSDWQVDRQVQRTEAFTGIEGITAQYLAMQESIRTIVNQTRKNLTRSDMFIVHARRLLLQATRTVANGGDPPGVSPSYYHARAIERVLPPDAGWRDALFSEMYPE